MTPIQASDAQPGDPLIARIYTLQDGGLYYEFSGATICELKAIAQALNDALLVSAEPFIVSVPTLKLPERASLPGIYQMIITATIKAASSAYRIGKYGNSAGCE